MCELGHRIRSVRVELVYDDGAVVRVDLAPLVARGGVFAPLADPAVFGRVEMSERGSFLSWPGEVELCADALYLEAEREEESPW